MTPTNKPRLSDVAKKNTTDRASKLANSFLPSAPAAAPAPVEPADSTVVSSSTVEASPVQPIPVRNEVNIEPVEQPIETAVKPENSLQPRSKERVRRSSTTLDLADTINQPVPDGLRCTRMIMLSDEHHDLLRELSFKFKKPMTVVLYNLLEPARQALQRDKQKGGSENV